MAKPMTASGITDGQIRAVLAKLEATMRKHRGEVPAHVAQHILGVRGIGSEMYAPFRAWADSLTTVPVRRVKVDRIQTPLQLLCRSKCHVQVAGVDIEKVPLGTEEEVYLHFFRPLGFRSGDPDATLSAEAIAEAYRDYGLVPDFYAQTVFNRSNPDFAKDRPNALQWRDGDEWIIGTFECIPPSRPCFGPAQNPRKLLLSNANYRRADLWFAGVPK